VRTLVAACTPANDPACGIMHTLRAYCDAAAEDAYPKDKLPPLTDAFRETTKQFVCLSQLEGFGGKVGSKAGEETASWNAEVHAWSAEEKLGEATLGRAFVNSAPSGSEHALGLLRRVGRHHLTPSASLQKACAFFEAHHQQLRSQLLSLLAGDEPPACAPSIRRRVQAVFARANGDDAQLQTVLDQWKPNATTLRRAALLHAHVAKQRKTAP
jgi:hypothetical protein